MTDTPNEKVPVENIQQFAAALLRWHSAKVLELKKLQEIPDGVAVSIDDGDDIKLTGDLRNGFQLGITVALSELGRLPFHVEYEDGTSQPIH